MMISVKVFTGVLLVVIFTSQVHAADDFKTKVEGSLKEGENTRNTLKILGLNVDRVIRENDFNIKDLCDLMKKYKPELISLQELPAKMSMILELKECFTQIKLLSQKKEASRRRSARSKRAKKYDQYEILGAANTNSKDSAVFNPIIFKQLRGLRSLGSNGTFWLSETPDTPFTKMQYTEEYHTCTWAKLRFAVRLGHADHEASVSSSFLKTLITVLRSKKERRTTKWVDFYFVNTQLDANIEVAGKQLKVLMEYLTSKIDEPNTPIILSGGINTENRESLYQIIRTIDGETPFTNVLTGARVIESDILSRKPTFIFQRGFQNLVGIHSSGDLKSQLAALLVQ